MQNVSGSVTARGGRDVRVDVLRGLALLTIFLDHIPGDVLNQLTMRNFGFSDAAEIFVMLAGFASMIAYGRTFDREGLRAGLSRVARRVMRLYLFQVMLLLATLVIVKLWADHYNIAPHTMAPLLKGGVPAIVRGVSLQALPSNLDVLPLYIVLLAGFPLIYAMIRLSSWLALAGSIALWLVVNAVPGLNLTNWIDGRGWFFNPFAWQIVFTIGALLAVVMTGREGGLPRRRWLALLCWAYLAVAFVETMPWHEWGLPDLAPVALAAPDKTDVSPLRLLHVLALVYLVLTWDGFRNVTRWAPGRWVEACGRNSLEIFSLGTLLSLLGRLVFRTYGASWEMQVAVNLVGLTAMVALGLALDRARRKARSTPLRPQRAAPAWAGMAVAPRR